MCDNKRINSSKFLKELVKCSEKAANIARLVKSEKYLFQLLIEKKTGDSANSRFVEDYKTLADVLIQESIRYDLSKEFPGFENRIFGEEKNIFTNKLNESIEVNILEDEEDMTNLLSRILNGDEKAAKMLSKCVLEQVDDTIVEKVNIDIEGYVDLSTTAIWIDPIDATEQYINGQIGVRHALDNGIEERGLPCCVVLIGAYDMKTGCPVAGVCNQPFYHMDNERCSSRIRTGYAANTRKQHEEIETEKKDAMTIVMSSSEKSDVIEKLKGFKIYYAPGAGYKSVCVLDDLADIYVLTKGTTYLWDICGPHAIILSMGGGIVEYDLAIENYKKMDLDLLQVKYHDSKDNARNKHGIIVYKDTQKLKLFLDRLT
ncbi:DgyrCDS6482 [Dimorphilus gyrociliatus]|uniref:DgyrCDS6482 n=1 Tax=Dimorphilus gyrociliatus TaxID=2664684 RepID=A0A7I8VNV2_9ANNE|nr:DgyrCDS6482 [Dimorphilus gyrociliatus]